MAVKERPILMSAAMVRATLAGTKTQTRRVVKFQEFQPSDTRGFDWTFRGTRRGGTRGSGSGCWQDYCTADLLNLCPYGVAGDQLWVRETFWCINDTDGEMGVTWDCGSCLSLGPEYAQIDYCATPECLDPPVCEHQQTVSLHTEAPAPGDWWLSPPDDWDIESDQDHRQRGEWIFQPWGYYTKHPSIHMPRWASRLSLEVVGVRVERLQDITAADIRAEGVDCPEHDFPGGMCLGNCRHLFAAW